MSTQDVTAYKNLFIETAFENLKSAHESLSKLSEDSKDKEAFELAHRSIHSLKSEFFAMGYKHIGTLCMIMENILSGIHTGEIGVSEELLRELKVGLHGLEESLQTVKEKDVQIDVSDYIKNLRRLTGKSSE